MVQSIDIHTVDARTLSSGPQNMIIGATVRGEVEASGIGFTYSAQLNAIELEALNGILLSAERRMRKALGLDSTASNGTGAGYQPEIER